jgi:hypothetical protein
MPAAPLHLLGRKTCGFILIHDRRLGGHLGLSAGGQTVLRGEHRSGSRGRSSGGYGSRTGSDADSKSQEFTTFHIVVLLGKRGLQRYKDPAPAMNAV